MMKPPAATWKVDGVRAYEVGHFDDYDYCIRVVGDDLIAHTVGACGDGNVDATLEIPIRVVLAVLQNAGKMGGAV